MRFLFDLIDVFDLLHEFGRYIKSFDKADLESSGIEYPFQ
jgi:hypothetical protein